MAAKVAKAKSYNVDIQEICAEKARIGDGSYAIAYALLELADAQQKTAQAIIRLGLNEAATPMGAVEMLALEVKHMSKALTGAAGNRRSKK